MKFNINKYEGNYAMHCKTEEEAKIFCRYLDSVGRRWADGTSYMSMTNWNYGPDTCYTFNSGTYCKKTYFLTRNYYTILEFSDFEWDNKNTKRKPVIIYQNGQDVIALDKETGEKAVAKCHPNDEFDFAIGAKIAFGRLYHSQDYIPEGNKAKCKPEFQVGDRVRCIKKDIRERITASTFTVVAKAPHSDFADRMLYLVQDEFARCFLLGEEGLKKCD